MNVLMSVHDAVLSFLIDGLTGASWWQIVVFTLVVTHITIAAVTIFLHRAQAHRALDLGPIPSHFFRFWLWMTTGMVTREWVAIHRKHHAKCETADDPHSPVTRGIKTVMTRGAELYRAEAKNQETIKKFSHGVPDDWMERHVYSGRSVWGVSLMMIINLSLFGVAGLAVWAVQMAWIPFWAAGVVNGVGHFWGYRNYDCEDASRNLLPWGILIGGEELHNNHHSFATSAKLSAKWYEFDIGWMYIRVLELLGLAKVRRTIPRPRFGEAKPVPDLDTLQAIVTHRYDVMTRYARSLGEVFADEARRLREAHGLELSARRLRRWVLGGELRGLDEAQRRRLEQAVEGSVALRPVVAMRDELAALWSRSNASREQLLAQLQDWVARAERSGIRQLQEFSLRLRSYA